MEQNDHAAGDSRRLFICNGGFLTRPRLRRILQLAGWSLRIGLPGPGDHVGIWGDSPTAWRGKALAARRGARLVRIEDAFLRSVLPGRARGPVAGRGPIGLLIDPSGLHFDPDTPSLIETLVHAPATQAQLDRARQGIARLIAADLSKYNAHLPQVAPPAGGYALVIDQTRGDASLRGAGQADFRAMLEAARDENPGLPLVVRSHPETARGLRPGHFSPADLRPGEILCDSAVSPWALLRGAARVYAYSSQLGYEAMLAGHRPRIFGRPFYAGWGLTDDQHPIPRRRPASIEQLFAASHLLAPVWYDPCRDRLTDFEGALAQIEAEARAWRQDHAGHLAHGIRLWKRPFMARFFGSGRGVRFAAKPGPGVTMAWAGRADQVPGALRIEDGFLRSRGLGAALVPPLSLVADDLGIYYDPGRESRFERLMAEPLPPGGGERALHLARLLVEAGITKYNLSGEPPDLPPGRRILVPGQVEDDASIRLGAGRERSNLALLERTRAENPNAVLVYKPHPDVEAGLRPGLVPEAELRRLADVVARNSAADALMGQVDEVWTMTSTLGFEALLRGLPVTTLGAPFYAGWGLTRDLGPVPARRQVRADLARLAHAALIAYPRYYDPVSRLPCPPEVALDRLRDPAFGAGGPTLRLLAKAQGVLAGHAWIWRR
ncbi:capsular polysaccharide biosynthesis protein [Paracoccus sp. P2]|uniref:Capsular polysaccharide biosynthesis protein n=3 Tax=Paracoccus pantotrophus TaxID=82367 RepID=A0A7H9BUN9_PARPN|nr:capsular polysaccharide biosynthesis protein [Paracoccus pantotrophus]MDF3854919.1 capsular polysaccharide biosynthesis protein [Paracoccus pantotrophus]QLH15067.1 capsular polysaccharide biosynthesis protein [Paracoccus pantotrophus]RNI16036.1 capsular polysaccharide biosynthesis protein [Paracoccus pantotrophus]WGR65303.1 capsular polysaccharide biosynthesis protein [Paracoccus pantotrophus]SFO54121.1 capsular polysaccharide export protein [Paracoccus pantotrophus]